MATFKISFLNFTSNVYDNSGNIVYNKSKFLDTQISEFYPQTTVNSPKSSSYEENKDVYSYCWSYDEKFSIHKNSQKELTFKMDKNVLKGTEFIQNPYTSILKVGSFILLEDKYGNQHLFNIKSIQFDIKEFNTVYSFSCQDSFSYCLSNQRDQYSIENDPESENFIGAQTVDWWAYKIFKDCSVMYQYLNLELDTKQDKYKELGYPQEKKIYSKLSGENDFLFKKTVFSGSGSANSILISLAEIYGLMVVAKEYYDRSTHTISRYFWFEVSKNEKPNGLKYSPYRNIQSLGLSASGENLVSVLNVKGGSIGDSNITLIPEVTPFFSQLFMNDAEWDSSNFYTGYFSDICRTNSCKVVGIDLVTITSDNIKTINNKSYVLISITKENKITLAEKIIPNGYDKFRFTRITDTKQEDTLISICKSGELTKVFSSITNNIKLYILSQDNKYYILNQNDEIPYNLNGKVKDYGFALINEGFEGYYIDEFEGYLEFYRIPDEADIEFAAIADQCPWLENKILDFSYFKNNNIITNATYNKLNKKFTNELRIINGKLLSYIKSYYNDLNKKVEVISDITNSLDKLGANLNSAVISYYAKNGIVSSNLSALDSIYDSTFTIKTEKSRLLDFNKTLSSYVNKYAEAQQLFLKNIYNFRKYFYTKIDFNVSDFGLWKYNFTITQNLNEENLKEYYVFKDNSSFEAIDDVSNFIEDDGTYKEPLFLKTSSSNIYNLIKKDDYVNKNNLGEFWIPKAIDRTPITDKDEYSSSLLYYSKLGEEKEKEITNKEIFEDWIEKNEDYSSLNKKYYYKQDSGYTKATDFFSQLLHDADFETNITNLLNSACNKDSTMPTGVNSWEGYKSLMNINNLKYNDSGVYKDVGYVYLNNVSDYYHRVSVTAKTYNDVYKAYNWTFFAVSMATCPLLLTDQWFGNHIIKSAFKNRPGWFDTTGYTYIDMNGNKMLNDWNDPCKLDYITAYHQLLYTTELTSYDEYEYYIENKDKQSLISQKDDWYDRIGLTWKNFYTATGSSETDKSLLKNTNFGKNFYTNRSNYYFKDSKFYIIKSNELISKRNLSKIKMIILLDNPKSKPYLNCFGYTNMQYFFGTSPANSVLYNNGNWFSSSAFYFFNDFCYSNWYGDSLPEEFSDDEYTITLLNLLKNIYGFDKVKEDDNKITIKVTIDNEDYHLMFTEERNYDEVYLQYTLGEWNYDPSKQYYNSETKNPEAIYENNDVLTNALKSLSKNTSAQKQYFYSVNKIDEKTVINASEDNIKLVYNKVENLDILSTPTFYKKKEDGKYEKIYSLVQLFNNGAIYNRNYTSSNIQYKVTANSTNIVLPIVKITEKLSEDGDVLTVVYGESQDTTFDFNNSPSVTIKDDNGNTISVISKEVTNIVDFSKDQYSNGQFWYFVNYDLSSLNLNEAAAEALFDYAALIDSELSGYWTTAHNMSLYCEYFIPESWKPNSENGVKNYFSNSILNKKDLSPKTLVQLSDYLIPNVKKISSSTGEMLKKYKFNYNEKTSVSDGDIANAIGYLDSYFYSLDDSFGRDNLAVNNIIDNLKTWGVYTDESEWTFSEYGTSHYYAATTGGLKWSDIPGAIIGSVGSYNKLDGWYPMFLKLFNSRYYNKNNTLYEQQKKAQIEKWREIYTCFPGVILEKDYTYEDAITSTELFNVATNYFKDMSKPQYTYNISVIDANSLQNYSGEELNIGDSILIDAKEVSYEYDDVYSALSKYLFISDISYDLRKDSDISITVDTIKYQDKMIRKLAKLIIN